MPSCPACNQEMAPSDRACGACGASVILGVRPGSPAASQLIGQTINGKYRVLSVLGEGGMGIVFKVQHLLFEKGGAFALKILHPKYSAQRSFNVRFLREVEIAMKLTHESIVQIRDFGVTEDRHLFYTMDYFEGESLKQALRREGRIEPRRASHIARKVLQGLAEAQRAGIIHRDLKPENILVHARPGALDSVRVLDFGIAKLLSDVEEPVDPTLTAAGRVLGTPKYMSPEQAAGQSLDGRSDLYSVGVVLYELLVGRPPFQAPTPRALLCAHMTETPPSFRDAAPDLQAPAQLEALVFRLLAKDPERRPASADEALALLGPADDATPSSVPSATGAVWGHLTRPRLRLPARIAVLAAAMAGATTLTWFGVRSRDAEALGSPHRPPPGPDTGSAALPPPPAPPAPPAPPDAAPAPPPTPAPRRLRCLSCNTVYRAGEKDGGICHGEPLVEVR